MKKRNPLLLGTIITLVVASFVFFGIFGSFNSKQYKLNKSRASGQATTFPGEFEKQQAIWLMWPSDIYNTGDRPVYPVTINIIKALSPYIRVHLMTQTKDQIPQIQSLLKDAGYTGNNVRYYAINHMSIWTRDVGPIFVKDNKKGLSVVNFGFNNYSRGGSPEYINTEGQVDKLTAQQHGLPVIDTQLISEGGTIESNGKGVLITVEAVLLKRNPGMTKQQIEKELSRVLGVKKVIWLKKGLAEDDKITSGHSNEFVRFAGPRTILLAKILPEEKNVSATSAESYRRLEENYNILSKATDQNGKRFNIIRIPMPPTLSPIDSSTGKTIVRSYLNYAVTNGAVLIQTYWKPGRSDTLKATEDQVKKTFQKVFPGRKIIGIDAENVNLWGGGLHCITQHMPAGK